MFPTEKLYKTDINLDNAENSPDDSFDQTTNDIPVNTNNDASGNMLAGSDNAQQNIGNGQPGKHHGYLSIPLATTKNGPAQHRIPVCVINGHQTGPTVTFMAGVHGDEHEGSLTLHRLARELNAESLHGTVYLLPAINIEGLQSAQRYNPSDQQNIDYAFPGSETGSPSERLAFEITNNFIKPAELIIDLRSSGNTLQFIPSAAVRFGSDKLLANSSEECMIAFGAPNSLRLPESTKQNSIQATVNAMHKQYVQTELGGGTINSVRSLSIAYSGCLNLLRHKGMLKQELELASTRLLEVRDSSYYVYATSDALYEPRVHPGENVWHQEPMGLLTPIDDTGANCTPVHSSRDACLLASHPGGYVNEGQLLAILAEEVQA